jgi:hypothetical protein
MTIVNDEMGQWEEPLSFDKLKREIATTQPILFMPVGAMDAARIMRKFWDEKKELDNPDDYKEWLNRVNESPLTTKQKELIKNTYQ